MSVSAYCLEAVSGAHPKRVARWKAEGHRENKSKNFPDFMKMVYPQIQSSTNSKHKKYRVSYMKAHDHQNFQSQKYREKLMYVQRKRTHSVQKSKYRDKNKVIQNTIEQQFYGLKKNIANLNFISSKKISQNKGKIKTTSNIEKL